MQRAEYKRLWKYFKVDLLYSSSNTIFQITYVLVKGRYNITNKPFFSGKGSQKVCEIYFFFLWLSTSKQHYIDEKICFLCHASDTTPFFLFFFEKCTTKLREYVRIENCLTYRYLITSTKYALYIKGNLKTFMKLTRKWMENFQAGHKNGGHFIDVELVWCWKPCWGWSQCDTENSEYLRCRIPFSLFTYSILLGA